jgi:hypothetical protein
VQDAQRDAVGGSDVGQMTEPPYVLELQVPRIAQVDVRLRRPVHQQCPGPRPIRIADQLGNAGVNLLPGWLTGDGRWFLGHDRDCLVSDRQTSRRSRLRQSHQGTALLLMSGASLLSSENPTL